MKIEPGDMVVCYTDGLTEARNERRELFGRQRLDEAIYTSAGRGVEGVKACVLDRLDGFLNGMSHEDDVTLFALERVH